MKWIGAFIFIGITTWLGFEWSNNLDRRPKHIRQFKSALLILEAEMLYNQLPLKEAFSSICKQVPKPINLFFDQLVKELAENKLHFQAIWEKNVNQLLVISALEINEIEVLKQFGKTLGLHDYDQQQKSIQLTISHLERELEDARMKQSKYGKMAKSIGFLCGLFIVLLLI